MMHRNLNLKVTVALESLVEALEANKKKHLADYEKAVVVYFKDAKDQLAKLAAKAETQDLTCNFSFSLHKPVNNEKLYDKYIGMFKMAEGDDIEITSEDYGCIVDDNWDWALAAATSNSFYSSKY